MSIRTGLNQFPGRKTIAHGLGSALHRRTVGDGSQEL